jgi:signal transduction histidine kinase
MSGEGALDSALLKAAEREQRLVAEELHDTICQSLAGTSLLVKLLLRHVEEGKPIEPAEIARISGYLDDAIEEARTFVDAQALASRPGGLTEALEKLARITGKKIRCGFHADAEIIIDEPRALRVLYQIAREIVRDMLRRARSEAMVLSLCQDEKRITLEIRNETISRPQPEIEDFRILQRYARAVGMKLVLESRTGGPAIVRCLLPRRGLPPSRRDGSAAGKGRSPARNSPRKSTA